MTQPTRIRRCHAGHLWQGDGWSREGIFGVDAEGMLQAVEDGPAETLGSWVLPGMPNLHSHAFQRAMAGLAERRGRMDDSFWSWRETMYAFAAAIGPDDLKAIAAQLYVEMLKAGYTQVCEFHYLHHQPGGAPYAPAEAMSLALVEAAREAGIALTLLPVLYMRGGFDGRPLGARQRRFGHEVDGYLRLLESLRELEAADLRVGIALHSLRAVPEDAMQAVLASGPAREGPIHIHIAEQLGEVQDCLSIRGARPVEWLLDHADVGARWCLVHATHLSEDETARLARSGAVAGLCPTTEANLGDGLFPLVDYIDAGGVLGIGSDSHISVSPVEELRWLEYGQRLASRHRNVAARHEGASVGQTLWRAALQGGAQVAGLPIGALQPGHRADLLVLDDGSPLLAAREAPALLDSFIFAGNTPLVRDVMSGGRWVVRDFRHHDEERIAQRYRETAQRLRRA
ncbi:formimidoylglutamate deiminase [Frateuria terrea]|uniref:Formimidoylglutamate deiminase n=1 Tax=Frateuria terrea TaxID=529704 RepID=A0A1H6QDL2_9GAMM|nr:formimidoylglutamate deiminase [Frateuria terrea]SEI38994.1 formimidoylglutamate deiminase [Frateuria terrea]SFP04494.1 formimidoylglutamate deiminase [Frateuria terrea]